MFKNLEISLKTLINIWLTLALLAGVLSSYIWMDSNKRWQAYLQKGFNVGISIHDYLQGHDVLPTEITTIQLSPNESRLADAALWQKLSLVDASDKISNYVLDDNIRENMSYKTIRVTILSKEIAYEKDEVSLNERIPNSRKLAEITQLLTRYCSQNTLLIKFDNELWRSFDGNAMWGCAAQPSDFRLASLIFLGVAIGSLITMASITTSKFTQFSEKIKNRFRKKDAFLFEVKGTKELRDLSKALNINIEKERASLAKRSMFLSGVSHDLGTPATRLLLRSEEIDDAELREKFEKDIVKMTDMIQSVLSYTQSEIVDDIHRPLSLVALVRTVVDDFADIDKPVSFTEPKISTTTVHNIFQGKNSIQKSRSFIPLDNFVVRGDSIALQRAISNLIDNALKYGRRAIVSISGNETYAEVSVLDNGQDVSVQDLEKLTQPFQRGTNASYTLGSGIGLAVVHNIAEQHGGSLTFARTEQGMTATMTILRT